MAVKIDTGTLSAAPRAVEGSRAARRLRRTGQVPCVVYGGGEEPAPLQIEAITLNRVLTHAGAIIDLSVDGAAGGPVLVKDTHRHPVTGALVHVDFLRVSMDTKVQTTVVLELIGGDESPGVVDGGVIELVTRELTVEALPGDLPDGLTHDVSTMQVGDTITLADLATPPGVELVDDPETLIATCTPPRLQLEDEEIETETERVEGEGSPDADGDAGDGRGAEGSSGN